MAGFGAGRGGARGGMGFGFRGSSPPWPYVGIGRGGLPRCGYFAGGAAQGLGYQPRYSAFTSGIPYTPQVSAEQELEFLRTQAESIGKQLENIQVRIHDLESKEQ